MPTPTFLPVINNWDSIGNPIVVYFNYSYVEEPNEPPPTPILIQPNLLSNFLLSCAKHQLNDIIIIIQSMIIFLFVLIY